jgi:hypothetical protein
MHTLDIITHSPTVYSIHIMLVAWTVGHCEWLPDKLVDVAK